MATNTTITQRRYVINKLVQALVSKATERQIEATTATKAKNQELVRVAAEKLLTGPAALELEDGVGCRTPDKNGQVKLFFSTKVKVKQEICELEPIKVRLENIEKIITVPKKLAPKFKTALETIEKLERDLVFESADALKKQFEVVDKAIAKL